MEQEKEAPKEKIAMIRARYEKLRWLTNCRVSRQTIENYTREIEQLQAQFN